MIQRAFEQRWPIEPKYRSALITRLMTIIADPNTSNREAISAAKALIAAEKQNQDDQIAAIQLQLQQHHAELDEIAAELGLTVDTVRHAIGQSQCDDGGTQAGNTGGAGPRPIEETRRADEGGEHRDPGPGEHGEA
jgi:hypothetical protein